MDGKTKKDGWDPILPRAMWIYTKEALTGGQILNQEQEEYLKKRMMSIMLCTNWAFASTFVDHGWVSARTIIEQEEEFFLSMEFELLYYNKTPAIMSHHECALTTKQLKVFLKLESLQTLR